jgi:hypothetical protein
MDWTVQHGTIGRPCFNGINCRQQGLSTRKKNENKRRSKERIENREKRRREERIENREKRRREERGEERRDLSLVALMSKVVEELNKLITRCLV